jgi:hypothetical protein
MKGLRDAHTAVQLPPPWSQMVAFLPFVVESYFDASGRHLIVSKLLADPGDPNFVPGVEITHWNGTPIGRYIDNLSWSTEGANPFARIALALRSLTVRPLGYMQVPDEDWVSLTYKTNSAFQTVVIPWRMYFPPTGSAAAVASNPAETGAATVQGLNRSSLIVNSTWLDLFSRGGTTPQVAPTPSNVSSRVVNTTSGEWGYIRIYSFDSQDSAGFLSQFAELLNQMPSSGLILDVRANPGGTITSGEGLLSLFSKNAVSPEPVSFRNTVATQKLGRIAEFQQWQRSLDMQLGTGDAFSQGFSLTTTGSGQVGVYSGPVVLIIDSLCYSTTDFVAAGMQDNGLATIIGVDPVTGAGGANVWTLSTLASLVQQVGGTDISPAPSGYEINMAVRRSTRIGRNLGLPVEGIGVFADLTYNLTLRDVLGQNDDLIEFAGRVLARMPRPS